MNKCFYDAIAGFSLDVAFGYNRGRIGGESGLFDLTMVWSEAQGRIRRPATGGERMFVDELTPERRDQLVDAMAKRVAQYGMITPAIFFLEMNKPISFIGSQAMHFFSPIVSVLFNNFQEYAYFFEDRQNVERLIVRLEELSREEEEAHRRQKEEARKKKEARNSRAP